MTYFGYQCSVVANGIVRRFRENGETGSGRGQSDHSARPDSGKKSNMSLDVQSEDLPASDKEDIVLSTNNEELPVPRKPQI